MAKQLFVNLPVKDLRQSMASFSRLGFTFDPRFTNEAGACLVIGQDSFVMLLTEEFFRTFTPNELCDARKNTEVLVCLSCESREQVDEAVRTAVAGGATTFREPQDHGFMYGHGFQDLDGHIWELIHMEPGAECPEQR